MSGADDDSTASQSVASGRDSPPNWQAILARDLSSLSSGTDSDTDPDSDSTCSSEVAPHSQGVSISEPTCPPWAPSGSENDSSPSSDSAAQCGESEKSSAAGDVIRVRPRQTILSPRNNLSRKRRNRTSSDEDPDYKPSEKGHGLRKRIGSRGQSSAMDFPSSFDSVPVVAPSKSQHLPCLSRTWPGTPSALRSASLFGWRTAGTQTARGKTVQLPTCPTAAGQQDRGEAEWDMCDDEPAQHDCRDGDRTNTARQLAVVGEGTLAEASALKALEEKVVVVVSDSEAWIPYQDRHTEMIITKTGRRLYPPPMVWVQGLDPEAKYRLQLHAKAVDALRYRFVQKCGWRTVGIDNLGPQTLSSGFFTPSFRKRRSVSGSVIMAEPISFKKAKVSNMDQTDTSNKIGVKSMHKYMLFVKVVQESTAGDERHFLPTKQPSKLFPLPETSFFAVTSYQNDELMKVKVNSNPFAKAFRERMATRQYVDIDSIVQNGAGRKLPRGSSTPERSDPGTGVWQQMLGWGNGWATHGPCAGPAPQAMGRNTCGAFSSVYSIATRHHCAPTATGGNVCSYPQYSSCPMMIPRPCQHGTCAPATYVHTPARTASGKNTQTMGPPTLPIVPQQQQPQPDLQNFTDDPLLALSLAPIDAQQFSVDQLTSGAAIGDDSFGRTIQKVFEEFFPTSAPEAVDSGCQGTGNAPATSPACTDSQEPSSTADVDAALLSTNDRDQDELSVLAATSQLPLVSALDTLLDTADSLDDAEECLNQLMGFLSQPVTGVETSSEVASAETEPSSYVQRSVTAASVAGSPNTPPGAIHAPLQEPDMCIRDSRCSAATVIGDGALPAVTVDAAGGTGAEDAACAQAFSLAAWLETDLPENETPPPGCTDEDVLQFLDQHLFPLIAGC